MSMNIMIFGCGLFGFGLTKYFGKKFNKDPNTKIYSYDIDKNVVDTLKNSRAHPYHFPGHKIPDTVIFTNKYQEVLKSIDLLVLAIPAQTVRETVASFKDIKPNSIIINTAKSLEIGTNMRLSEVIHTELSKLGKPVTVATLSGGMIAEEFVNEAPLGADIACPNYIICKSLQKIIRSNKLRVYGNTDQIGVEYSGAFKNVIAILAGIVSGLKLPLGSETHLISRASEEARKMAVMLGASEHTFSTKSQCWGNDLWMSCIGNSRNRKFGFNIGSGKKVDETLKSMKKERKIVEGYNTIKVAYELGKELNLNNIILNELYEIVYNRRAPKDGIENIMDTINEEII